jgi:hypothetical protein
MARRSALRRPKGSPSGLSGEEEPSAFAELWVMKVPLDDERNLPEKAVIPAASVPVSGIISMLRRLRPTGAGSQNRPAPRDRQPLQ